MSRPPSITIGLFLLALLCTLGAADLGKYRLILDKNLFGSEPPSRPTPRPTPTPPPQTPSWAESFRMTMITFDEFDRQVRVGLQNNDSKQSVLLIQGENTHPEYKLLAADFENGTARVSYRGTPHDFELSSGPPPRSSSPRQRPSNNRPQPRTPTRTPDRQTHARPTPEATPRFRTREELQAHLKEVQMDAIRTGKPPLPIPLTKEMDAQLVEEGALPPQE